MARGYLSPETHIQLQIQSVNDSARSTRATMNMLLLVALYLIFMLMAADDEALLREEAMILPQFSIALPIVDSFIIAPPLFLMLYMLLTVQMQGLRERYRALKKHTGGKYDTLIFPFSYLEALRKGEDRRNGAACVAAALMLYIAPAALLFAVYIGFLRYRSMWMSFFHLFFFCCGVTLAAYLRMSRLREDTLRRDIPKGRIWWREEKKMQALLTAVAFCAAYIHISFVDLAPVGMPAEMRKEKTPHSYMPDLSYTQKMWETLWYGQFRLMTLQLSDKLLVEEKASPPLLAEAYRLAPDEAEKEADPTSRQTLGESRYGRVKRVFSQPLDLRGRDLSGADFNRAVLYGADFLGADLSGANLYRTNLTSVSFHYANLTGASLSFANLTGANLSKANLSSTRLSFADLTGTNLRSANLTGANLSSIDLTGANLSSTDLTGANLSSTDLTGANLVYADLTGANLSSANLVGANLSSANLLGAELSFADMTGAYFRSSYRSDATSIGGNRMFIIEMGMPRTYFPEDFSFEGRGMIDACDNCIANNIKHSDIPGLTYEKSIENMGSYEEDCK